MKLKLLSLFLLFICYTPIKAQIKIGDNPQNLDASSVLELESTTRTLVITRITTAQMDNITPLQGALIYNTETLCFHYYDGTEWINLCGGDELNTTNVSLALESGDLVLTDSDNNILSVPLEEINTQTFTDDAIENGTETIIITETGNNFNFEVGMITGQNILDSSINGFLDIQPGSITDLQLQDDAVGLDEMQDASVGSPEIINGSIMPLDIGIGGNNQVLRTNDTGTAVEWETLDFSNILGQDLTTGDGSIAVNSGGIGATLINTDISVAPNGITNDKIADNAVNTENIADGQVQTNDIADGDITNIKLDKTNIPLSGFGDAALDVSLGGNKLINVLDPTNPQDAATMNYVDTEITTSNQTIVSADAGNSITESGTDGGAFYDDTTIQADITANTTAIGTKEDLTNKDTNVALGTSDTAYPSQNAVKTYVDTEITASNQTIVSSDAGNLIQIGVDSGAFYNGDFNNLINVPTGITDGDNDTTYSAGTGLGLTGTVFSVNNATIAPDWANITNIPAGFLDGTDDDNDTTYSAGTGLGLTGTVFSVNNATIAPDWANIANIPAGFLDGTDNDNDTTYSAGTGLGLTGTVFSVNNATIAPDWANITNIPANLDLDETDDFNGTWAALTGVPAGFVDNVDNDTQYTAGAGLTLIGTTFAFDSFTATYDWANITNVPVNLDLDGTDDFDGTWSALTGVPAGFMDNVDNDTQYTAGAGLTLTGTTFTFDNLSATFDWASIANVPVNLDLDGTDDFDGTWAALTGVPAGFLDNVDNDTQYTPGSGLTLTGTTFSIANISGGPGGNISANSMTQDDIGDNAVATGEIVNLTILNEDISNTAGIDGLKIVPNFNLDIVTTGGLSVGADILLNGNSVQPDYVFQKYFNGYSNLKPSYSFDELYMIEEFIKANHHLPGIQSAETIKAQGFWNLGKTSKINLEKIEELFLHTIEQEKKINQLKSDNEVLSKKLKALENDIDFIKKMVLSKKKNN